MRRIQVDFTGVADNAESVGIATDLIRSLLTSVCGADPSEVDVTSYEVLSEHSAPVRDAEALQAHGVIPFRRRLSEHGTTRTLQ